MVLFQKLQENFKITMKFLGKTYSPFVINAGSFLEDRYEDHIVTATHIFANNFCFAPPVNLHLEMLLQKCKDDTKVISSKEFVPRNFKMSQRTIAMKGNCGVL